MVSNDAAPSVRLWDVSKSRVDENGSAPFIKDPDTKCYTIGDDVEGILSAVRAKTARGQPRKGAKRV